MAARRRRTRQPVNAATVIGADFPTVALREAHWDPTTASVTDIPLGAMASFLNLMPRLRRARTRCSGG